MFRTFVMLKPDALERGLVGKIITRFEEKGLTLLDIRKIDATEDLLATHYEEHKDKDFFVGLVNSMKDRAVICMIWGSSLPNIIELVRVMVGATDPLHRVPGSIRGDFSSERTRNLIHASDSTFAANREIAIWFPDLISD